MLKREISIKWRFYIYPKHNAIAYNEHTFILNRYLDNSKEAIFVFNNTFRCDNLAIVLYEGL